MLAVPARAFANEINNAVRLGACAPALLGGFGQGGLLQSEVGKNVNRLSVGKGCRGVITVVRHWLVNGSCGCDRNRTQDQSSGQDARNFRNHNRSPFVSDRPSTVFK